LRVKIQDAACYKAFMIIRAGNPSEKLGVAILPSCHHVRLNLTATFLSDEKTID